MKKIKNLRIIFLILISFIIPNIVFANAAAPPTITIILSGLEDYNVRIELQNGETVRTRKEKRYWESYFDFWLRDIRKNGELENAKVVISKGNVEVERIDIPIEEISKNYHSTFVFDNNTKELRLNSSTLRSIILVCMRVLITLIVEGIIFYAFGYRDKISWIAFFVINLITQGILNWIMTGGRSAYVLIPLIVLEIIIFVVEAITLSLIIKEKKKSTTTLFALTANFLSFIIGAWVILNLPI